MDASGDKPERSSTAPTKDQHHASAADASESTRQQQPSLADADMDVARKFLRDVQVRGQARERKIEFLRSKGLDDGRIEILLRETETNQQNTEPSQSPQSETQNDGLDRDAPAPSFSDDTKTPADRAPIITYPEFLARPPRPPPLLTPSALLNTLYAVAGLSIFAHGTSTHVVAPMVESLNHARGTFHQHASGSLSSLVSQLERTVSALPEAYQIAAGSKRHDADDDDDDDESEYDDPAELFHRDIGTQTITPPTTASSAGGYFDSPAAALGPGGLPGEPLAHRHARQVARLASTASLLRDELVMQAEDLADCKASIDVFNEELLDMTYPGKRAAAATAASSSSAFPSLYDMKRAAREPDDEIKNVRDSIRRVKGALLSTKNFP